MTDPTRALDGLRVIEYGGMVSAPYAAKLMADLGAEVIKVEPAEGDPPAVPGRSRPATKTISRRAASFSI